MWPDYINAAFQVGGSLFTLLNVWRLYSTKCARGVHWVSISFFVVWGFWNTFFYIHLEQWFSFWAGIAMLLANLLYTSLIIYYNGKEKGTV